MSLQGYVYYLVLCSLHITAERYIVPIFSVGNYTPYSDYFLIITSASNTLINVTGSVNNESITPIINENVTATYVSPIKINLTEHLPVESYIGNSRITVDSIGDISLQVITRRGTYYEGFLALPASKLGSEYYIGTICARGGFCQITMATVDTGLTKVYIQLPSLTDQEVVYCRKDKFWKSGRNKVIELTFPDVIQITTQRDLSGSYIYSNKPLSVVAGTHSFTHGTETFHFLEQLTPTNEWDKEFIFKFVGQQLFNNIVNVIASQNNTKTVMTQFPTIILSRGQHIQRILYRDVVYHLLSSKPVQVILFVNIPPVAYTFTATPKPGMTLIPGLQHVKHVSTAGCKLRAPVHELLVITRFNASIVIDDKLEVSGTVHQPYGFYEITKLQTTGGTRGSYIISSNVTGIITCGNSAIMPLAPLVLNSVQIDVNNCSVDLDGMVVGDGIDNDCDGQVDEDNCYENFKLNASSSSATPDEYLIISIHDFHIIQLRMSSFCSAITLIQLKGNNNEVIALRVGQNMVTMSAHGLENNTYIRYNITGYHNICESIHPFWLLDDGSYVCFDFGPSPASNCSAQTVKMPVNYRLTRMKLLGLFSSQTYWIDLYRKDCGNIISPWRCSDVYSNCSEYSRRVCTEFPTWADVFCQQYCELCTPDSFGRLFAVAFPKTQSNISYDIFISHRHFADMGSLRGVSASVKDEQMEVTGNLYMSKTVCDESGRDIRSGFMKLLLPSNMDSNMFLYFDSEVALHVRKSYSSQNLGDQLFFSLNPIDTAGHEYMTLFFDHAIVCRIIAHDGGTDVWQLTYNSTKYLGTLMQTDEFSVTLSDDECSGTIFYASRPLTIFCGGYERYNNWQQLTSTSSWGKEYVVLPFVDERFVEITLRIITNTDKTTVFLSGNSSKAFVLDRRGKYIDQIISQNTSYTVRSTYPICVGILYQSMSDDKCVSDPVDSAWVILTSVSNYIHRPSILIPSWSNNSDVCAMSVDATLTVAEVDFESTDCTGYFINATGMRSNIMGRSRSRNHDDPFIQSTRNFVSGTTAPLCHVTVGSAGDGFDNDCDGSIDEEGSCATGYGAVVSDNDADGAFGEDCASTFTGSPLLPLPTPPFCPVETGNGVWQVCDCPCTWVHSLNLYKNLSIKEKLIWNQLEIARIKKAIMGNSSYTSRHVIANQAADDTRQSSTMLGIVACALMLMILFLFVILDFKRFYLYCKSGVFNRARVYTTETTVKRR